MSNMRDAPVLKAVADVVKEHVGKAFANLRDRIDKFDGRLKSIESELVVKALGPTTSDVVDIRVEKVVTALGGRIDGIEQQIKSLPKPERGEKGDQGDRGDIGPPGNDALPAKDGRDGDKGEKGDPGVNAPPVDTVAIVKEVLAQVPIPKDGKDGLSIKGDSGIDGIDGKDGLSIKGEAGERGQDGALGERGATGDNGIDGAPGIAGKDGGPGADGIKGIDGINGKDADPADTAAIAASVLAKIVIPENGKDGKDAPLIDTKALAESIFQKVLEQIPPPIVGADGKDGKSVDLDAVRVLIASEVTKAVDSLPPPKAGRDGRDGRVGDAGMAGRDAIDTDILEGIDEMVSYQRGTYALHRGGTIKAYRTTDPIHGKDFHAAGWQVIQEGIADGGSALSADERTVVQSLELTSGKLLISKFSIPTLSHKGTWKPEQRYERGNFATMAGSTWHCNELTQDRPGISNAWTLVVKRGSDGKDGKDATANGAHR